MTRENTQSRFIARFINQSYDKKRLGDVSSVFSGKTIDLALENEGGPVAYLKVADLNLVENDRVVTTSSRFVSEQTAKTSGLVPIGATIFPKNGAAALHNKKRITSIITCIDMNTMAVYSTSENVKPEYLYSFLESQDLAALTLVGAIPQIRAKDVQALLIPMPTVEEQERYIAMMHQADKSKFNGFKSRFFSQFGELPFDHKWKDVLTIINGKAYGEEYKDSGPYPICGSGGIMGYGEKKMCDRNTIILGRKGNIDKPIYMTEDYWIVDTAFCLCANTELVHPLYLYYWCKQFDFQKLNKQAVLPSLTRSDLEQIDIQVPEMTEQLAFVEIVRQADKSKYLN